MNLQRTLFRALLALSLIAVASCHSKENAPGGVVIGAILPLSGNDASYGLTARNAYQIAQDDARQQGRVPLNIVYGDSQFDAGKAGAEYTRLVEQEHAVGFVEATGSQIALELAARAAQDKVPILSAVDSTPRLTSHGGDFFFRVIPSDLVTSRALCDWAMKNGLRSAALVVNQQNGWAVGFKGATLTNYREQGGQLPDDAILTVTNETSDFNSGIARLNRNKPQVWFVGLMGRQAGLFVQQAAAQGIKGPFIAVDNLVDPVFVAAAGAEQTATRFALPAAANLSELAAFSAKYQQRFNRLPDFHGFEDYDAYFVMLKAVELVQGSGQPVTGSALQQQLKAMDTQGIMGRIQFDEHHDLVNPTFGVFTYDGKGNVIPVR